jgi:hypothetical protein
MLQVRCPKCAVTLSLKQSPPGGTVKCPKCAAIISVGQPAQAAGVSRPTAGNAPAAPRQATAPPSGIAGDIDFRSIPVPPMHTPSGHFPMPGQARVYDGPISLDPIPVQRTGDDDDEPEEQPQGKGQNAVKKAKQTKVIVSLVAGVLALVAAGGAGFVLMGGSSGGGGSTDASSSSVTP